MSDDLQWTIVLFIGASCVMGVIFTPIYFSERAHNSEVLQCQSAQATRSAAEVQNLCGKLK